MPRDLICNLLPEVFDAGVAKHSQLQVTRFLRGSFDAEENLDVSRSAAAWHGPDDGDWERLRESDRSRRSSDCLEVEFRHTHHSQFSSACTFRGSAIRRVYEDVTLASAMVGQHSLGLTFGETLAELSVS
jgi:hypothetical protein